MNPRVLAVYGGGALSRAWDTKRLGSKPDPPDFDTCIPPEERRVLISIIDSITPRYIFSVKLKLRGFHFHPPLLLLAISRCPSTFIHSPSPLATARCPTCLPTLNLNPPRLLLPVLLRSRLVAGHPRAVISSASLARLRRTSKTQIA